MWAGSLTCSLPHSSGRLSNTARLVGTVWAPRTELSYPREGSPQLWPNSRMTQYWPCLPFEACVHTISLASLKGVKKLFQTEEGVSPEPGSYLGFPLRLVIILWKPIRIKYPPLTKRAESFHTKQKARLFNVFLTTCTQQRRGKTFAYIYTSDKSYPLLSKSRITRCM